MEDSTFSPDLRTVLSREEAREVYDNFARKGHHTAGKDASGGYGGPAVSAMLSMADFELKKLLGRGAFGTVLLVQLKPEVCSTIGLAAATGSSDSSPTSAAGAADTRPAADASIATEAKRQHHFFAVKVLRKLDMTSYTKHRTQLEREIMARVHHPFIATLEFAGRD